MNFYGQSYKFAKYQHFKKSENLRMIGPYLKTVLGLINQYNKSV
jgi:hypothetical protein